MSRRSEELLARAREGASSAAESFDLSEGQQIVATAERFVAAVTTLTA